MVEMIRIAAGWNEVIPEEALLVSVREPSPAEMEYGRSLTGLLTGEGPGGVVSGENHDQER